MLEIAKHQSFFPVPKHQAEKYGDDWVQPAHFVGDGPYRLVSWRLGDYIRVEKNPRFYDASHLCVDRIDFYPTPDSVMAERRVARGELDVNTNFQSNRIDRLRRTMPAAVRTHTSLATTYLSLNTRDIPAFKDVRVRRALSEAVDREFITGKLMRADQVPAYAFVPPGTANYETGPHLYWSGRTLAQRQAEARRLLTAAGYGATRPLTVEIKAPNNPDSLLISEAVQADWAAIGVTAKVMTNENQIAFAAYRDRDYQVGVLNWYADYNDPMTFLGLLKSDTGAQNYGDYKSATYDALLDASDHEPDARKRADILAEAEQVMLNDEALIPVFYVVNRNLVSAKITGWDDNVGNFHRARWLCVKP
jgi:oligopeptide transport system substrate-binding protein